MGRMPDANGSLFNRENLRFVFAVYSWVVSIGLIILSIYGFKHLGDAKMETMEEVEASTSFGCLSFLGFCFGVMLFLAETRWEYFFVLFGFLRYRLGRAIIYAVAGIMTLILGKGMGKQCDCPDYMILIIEGAAAIAACVFQIMSIFLFGFTGAPRSHEEPPRESSTSQLSQSFRSAASSTSKPAKSETEFSDVVTKPEPKKHNSHLPSWMHA